MRATRVRLRDFRNYERGEIELADALTVVTGPNGAGKTNLLEAIYFACTARSPRTSNDRELIRKGGVAARVELELADGPDRHVLEVGFAAGEAKRMRVDGSDVDRPASLETRPLVGVFMPERLELVKGAPAARRAHIDQFAAALWPARAATRTSYGRALAQRNALLARVRAGASQPSTLDAWDAELAQQGLQLMADRRDATELLAGPFAARAAELGLPGVAELAYRPRSQATTEAELLAELAARQEADLERGFTVHGPHRDDVRLGLDGASLRVYGSQGQQRTALLALLFAERDVLGSERPGRGPLMLLDDVMSELDATRRELLGELLTGGGQAVVTATEADHVPGAQADGATVVEVNAGAVAGLEVSAA
jgi:DNA replication and repair protein RecF